MGALKAVYKIAKHPKEAGMGCALLLLALLLVVGLLKAAWWLLTW